MKQLCTWGYRVALSALFVYAIFAYTVGGLHILLHEPAYYIPVVGMFLMFSGQADLLEKIRQGEMVSIKARAIDFIHWFLLLFMLVGRWMVGGITIWGFLLNVALLGIIGWQVGVGIQRRWYPTVGEKILGGTMLVGGGVLGLSAGTIRYLDPVLFGWGWALESIATVASTLIVIWW